MDLVGELEPLLLGAVRTTLFLVLAPPFSHRAIPGAVKAMLGLALALALLPAETVPSTSTADFLGRALGEAVVGGGLAMLVAVVFAAVRGAGSLIDMFGGFEMSSAFDPMSMTQGGRFSHLYALTATVLLFVSGGYQLVIGGLARSFAAVPLGAGMAIPVLANGLTVAVGEMFLAALQVAGPLIAVLFLADMGLGLITRVAPALNAFALGFPLKILISLSLGTVAILALPAVVTWLLDDAMAALMKVLR